MVSKLLSRVIVVILLLACPALGHAAKPQYVKLSVQSEEVYAGDVVVLEIEHTGLLEPLETDILNSIGFVRRETTGTRISVLGGKVIDIQIRRIEIALKDPGIIVIGPLISGDVQSNSVSVKVLKDVPSDWKPGPDDVVATMQVSQPDPFVQQQFVLDLEFKHRFPLASEAFELPDLSGFRVIERYAARRPASLTDDWRTIRWRYLLFAERSGDLSIGPFSATGSITKSRRDRGNFAVSASPINLNIRPAQSDGWWLPAQQLSISETWSKDKRDLSAGDETVRSITVDAVGITAEQIPDVVMPPARGLKITALGKTRETTLTDDRASARAIFDFRVRALSPIPVFPDTIRVTWFDVNENRERQAILPAQRIQIGMPDREALLAAVGEQRSDIDRLTETLQNAGYRGWLLPVAILLFGLSMIFALAKIDWRSHVERSTLRRLHRSVRSELKNGDYLEALKLLRDTPGDGNRTRDVALTDKGWQLRKACEQQVFGTPDSDPDSALTDLGDLAQQPVFIHREPKLTNQLLPGL